MHTARSAAGFGPASTAQTHRKSSPAKESLSLHFRLLFVIDPALAWISFKADVKTKWAAVKAAQLDTLPAWIDQEAAALQQAQQNNFQRWPILGEYVWPNSEVANTYQ